ncbi:MAG: hypothetical protein ACAI35_08665 [Candidatus Methylacidiphilales bacterium]
MPDLSGLGAFGKVNKDTVDFDVRLQMHSSGDGLQGTSRQPYTNPFSRAWDCLTRGKDEVLRNKNTADVFIGRMEKVFGKDIADVARKDLSGQINKGRPLTAYRIKVTIDKAKALAKSTESVNSNILNGGAFDKLFSKVLKDQGEPNPDYVDKTALKKAVNDAIRSDPRFSQKNYAGKESEMLKDFYSVANYVVKKEMLQVLRPNTMALSGLDPQKPKLSQELTKLTYPESAVRDRFEQAENLMDSITGFLADDEGSQDKALAFSHMETLNRMLSKDSPDEPWRLLDLPGPGEEGGLDPKTDDHRNAMMKDVQHLRDLLAERTGLNKLEPPTQKALSDARALTSAMQENAHDGDWPELARTAVEDRGKLNDLLLELNKGLGKSPESDELLQAMISECEDKLAKLDLLDDAQSKGIKPNEMQWMRRNGFELADSVAVFSTDGTGPLGKHEADTRTAVEFMAALRDGIETNKMASFSKEELQKGNEEMQKLFVDLNELGQTSPEVAMLLIPLKIEWQSLARQYQI